MNLGWRVSWRGTSGITAAETRGRAVARLRSHLTGLGYAPEWAEIRAARAPEFDAWACGDPAGLLYDDVYARRLAGAPGRPADLPGQRRLF